MEPASCASLDTTLSALGTQSRLFVSNTLCCEWYTTSLLNRSATCLTHFEGTNSRSLWLNQEHLRRSSPISTQQDLCLPVSFHSRLIWLLLQQYHHQHHSSNQLDRFGDHIFKSNIRLSSPNMQLLSTNFLTSITFSPSPITAIPVPGQNRFGWSPAS